MTATPRTPRVDQQSEEMSGLSDTAYAFHMTEFARQLERELKRLEDICDRIADAGLGS